jgi:hypothetical protein
MQTNFTIRAATTADIPVLQKLIERSGIGLSVGSCAHGAHWDGHAPKKRAAGRIA